MSTPPPTSGQTPLDEEDKLDLIPIALTREALNHLEQENILQARHWAMQQAMLAKHDLFTDVYIRALHKRMYGLVWRWAGRYRTNNRNIGVNFYLIPAELRQLRDDAEYWLKHQTYAIADLAILFHHRLVKIHPFPNGNGRHARLVADAIIAKHGGTPLTWGRHLNANPDVIRRHYITALRQSDKGNHKLIIEFAKNETDQTR